MYKVRAYRGLKDGKEQLCKSQEKEYILIRENYLCKGPPIGKSLMCSGISSRSLEYRKCAENGENERWEAAKTNTV